MGILLEFSGNSYDIFWDVWLGDSDFGFLWEIFGNSFGILREFYRNSLGILLEFFWNLKLHTDTKL